MSYLTGEELREACELADLPLHFSGVLNYWMVEIDESFRVLTEVWVPSYVADLLVAKVRDRRNALDSKYSKGVFDLAIFNVQATATTTQRIRAAVSVLKGASE